MNIMYVSNDIGLAGSLFQNAKVQLENKEKVNTVASILKGTKTQETSDNSAEQVQKILNKFRAGQKLSSAELQYLKEYAPDMYEKVVRIQQQREELEQEVKKADSRSEAQDIVSTKISMSMNGCEEGDDFTADAINNQFRAALKKFKGTDESEDTDGIDDSYNADKEDFSVEDTQKNSMYAPDGELKEEQKQHKGNKINFAV